ncbi:hypothetical protein IL306_011627 [Fusarium sp. DS 682]|nr:hypothetical protein IL306_011627 [Fusarium sp. DS 682]
MPESIERQHTECRARNLDFTFDAEKVCGVRLEVTTTSHASSTAVAVTTSHASHESSTSTTLFTTSEAEATTVPRSVEGTSTTAQGSSTGGAAPVTDGAPRLNIGLGEFIVLLMVAGMLL